MKRFFCILLVLALAGLALTGCDRRSEAPEEAASEDPNFEPETTAVGGLTQAVEEQAAPDAAPADENGDGAEAPEDTAEAPADSAEAPEETAEAPAETAEGTEPTQSAVEDQPAEEASPEAGESTPEAGAQTTASGGSPFATPTPQPNASIAEYSTVSASGLGFRFDYPSDWVNIPGRSTVCYVQPLEEGTVYPARVAVTMKRMPHTTGYSEARTELANYLKKLMTQYDSSTFKVNTNLDIDTRFMGKRAMGTTYLAYDGPQEIIGYAVITYFDHYLFVFHFLCAYEDYESFKPAMEHMRDSVQADASVAPN